MGSQDDSDRKSLNAAANLLTYNGLPWSRTIWSSLLEVPVRPLIVAIPHSRGLTPQRWQQITNMADCIGTKFFHRTLPDPEATHTWN